MLPLYAATLLVNAFLLFSVQPMVSKMLLPIFGGAPAVWTTCMVFFQAALLGGYAYGDFLTHRLAPRKQALVHGLLILAPFFVLPISIPGAPPAGASPVYAVLRLLATTTALPFFLVASGSPLLQRWFSRTSHRRAADPYFLYAASNVGNLLALIFYPTLIENHLTVAAQSRLWLAGYAVLAALTLACAAMSRPPPAAATPTPRPAARLPILRWLLLSFVPSSLMLGATTYITTDIAAIPMLWLLPLALYLLSFSCAFARLPARLIGALEIAAPLAVLTMIFFLISSVAAALWVSVTLHLATLFIVAVVLHARLAAERPGPQSLTRFYLLLSVGGALGGIFNAAAPLIFNSIFEYPITLTAACCLLRPPRIKFAIPVALVAVILALAITGFPLWAAVAIFVPYFALSEILRPAPQFRAAIAALLVVNFAAGPLRSHILHRTRSFFGVLSVFDDADENVRKLRHGTTFHGTQSLDPALRGSPLSYYGHATAIGKTMAVLEARKPLAELAVVGLGTGTMAAYARRGQGITYFEIDEAVVRIARDPDFFTYLTDAEKRGARLRIVMGDARLMLREEVDHRYDLLVIDAFSSDAIPVHLMTREAFALYLSKLTADGILALHISNKYLDLEPVAVAIGRELKLTGTLGWNDDDPATNVYAATWLLFSRSAAALDPIARGEGWRRLRETPIAPWTDDFSNLLGILSWDVKITKQPND